MISVKDWEVVRFEEYTVFYTDKEVILLPGEYYSEYVYDANIATYAMIPDEVRGNGALSAFAGILASSNLPDDTKEYFEKRTAPLIGSEIVLYSEKEAPGNFCKEKKFAKYYGIENPAPYRLRVVGEYVSEADFDASFEPGESFLYGLFDIRRAEISPSYIYGSPVQTKMCFGDFAASLIRSGSRFVKMKMTPEGGNADEEQ